MDEQGHSYGRYSRFYIEPYNTRFGRRCYMVLDAEWLTDDELFKEGRRSPVVNNFWTAEEAKAWCDQVEAGQAPSIPHEANFEGWPALRDRVQERLK
jgi:hypothetical protein